MIIDDDRNGQSIEFRDLAVGDYFVDCDSMNEIYHVSIKVAPFGVASAKAHMINAIRLDGVLEDIPDDDLIVKTNIRIRLVD